MRLIDADAFKENMDKMCDAEGWLEPLTIVIVKYIKQKIDDQKTIEQKTGKWIPCSERLPEQDGEYLVTAISDMGTLPVIMITSFFKDSNYGKNHWHTGWSKSKVMAWMPLSAPFVPKEEVRKNE